MKLHVYQGKKIIVTYDAQRCIHARECVHGAPEVFDVNAKPWVDPDKADAKTIASVIQHCPTGALHYQAEDSKLAERPDPSNSVTTMAHGPLYVRGSLNVVTEDGQAILSDTRMALCRCGASKNKPLCDNAHFAIAFEDEGMAAPGEKATAEMATSGKLNLVPTTNGPLHLQGQVTIRNAEGQVIFEGTDTWLCRCGGSATKPFCDGTHQRIGFQG
ncbi:MAG TPA: CDGSH iron-sulfur domain-containing protein [Terriglobales bacterium]|nr:CDGSH iron-sulfur domain-containing protein [Terriglobales bacterium]